MERMISVEKFLQETGLSRAMFEEARNLGILPILPDGNIDFRGGWFGVSQFIESAKVNVDYLSQITSVRREVEGRIKGLSHSQPVKQFCDSEDPRGFFSEEGRQAFEKNAPNIRIKGQKINSEGSQEWWEKEGFLSEEGAAAFKKASANGQIRIFDPSKRGRG